MHGCAETGYRGGNKGLKVAQTAQVTAERAQKTGEEKLKDMERALAEEKKKNDELKGQLDGVKKASKNAAERNSQTILTLHKDLGKTKAAISLAVEEFKALAEYLAEKALYFLGGFEKKFPVADLQGINPEPPSEGETMTDAGQSSGEDDQDDAQS